MRNLIWSSILFLSLVVPSWASDPDPVLWYTHPAQRWGDALPIGNGRLGGMVFGGVEQEHIQLNEDTIWNGKKRNRINPEALKALPEVRRLLFAGKPLEAEALEERTMMGIPNRQPPYQPLGDLNLTFAGDDNAVDYRRELNLATGIVRITYRIADATCTREVFSSAPDQVLVVRLTCDKPRRLSLHATLTRSQDSKTTTAAPDRVILEGEAIAHTDFWITPNLSGEKLQKEKDQLEPSGVRFGAELRAINEGGHVEISGSDVIVSNADAATLLVVAATNYRGGDPVAQCAQYLARRCQALRTAEGSTPRGSRKTLPPRRSGTGAASQRGLNREPSHRRAIGQDPTGQGRSRTRRSVLPIWPLPADGKQPPGNDGGQPPGHLE